MKNSGWVKAYRKMRDWVWYRDSHMVHLFMHLIWGASHEPKEWNGIKLARGQLITGRKQLSKETGISERTIRTCLERLKTTSEVTIKSTNKFSIITICNYDTYQPSQIDDRPADSPTSRPINDHKEEVKEVKKKEKNIVPPKIEWIEKYARERGSGIDPQAFFDHYQAIGWVYGKNKQPIKDWQAAIHTWEKNGKSFGQGRQGSQSQSRGFA